MELTLKQRTKAINHVTLWGVLVNILLASTKLVGGVVGQSQALIADGLHSASDLASDGMVLLAANPYPQPRFAAGMGGTTGHNTKLECFVTLNPGVCGVFEGGPTLGGA